MGSIKVRKLKSMTSLRLRVTDRTLPVRSASPLQ